MLDGNEVMERIDAYITNVSNLIPDSITQQNIWANGPVNGGLFGLGVSGSFTLFNKKGLGGIVDSTQDFTGKNADLQSFPTNIPFLPAASGDIRWGPQMRNSFVAFDVGFTGFLFDSDWVNLLPAGNRLFYWTAGADARVSILQEGMFGIAPSVFIQGGYFFSSFDWSFEAKWHEDNYDGGGRDFDEYVNMQFRTQTFFGALQVAKKVFIFTPFFGYKVIICDKDTDFAWGTSRSVSIGGNAYPMGMDYKSKGEDGAYKVYHELYGGVALFGRFITLGAAYNIVTEHFGANLAVRFTFQGIGEEFLPGYGVYNEPEYNPKTPKPPKEPKVKPAVKPAVKTEEEKLAEREAAVEKAQAERDGAAARAEAEKQRQADLQARREALAEKEAEEARIRQEEAAAATAAAAERRRLEQEEAAAAAAERRSLQKEAFAAVQYPGGLSYGSLLINGGVGLGVPLRAAAGAVSALPPLLVSLDYARPLFGQPFTLGGMVGISAEKGGYDSTHIAAAFRIAWHPGLLSGVLPGPLDLYAAGVLGFAIGIGEKITPNVLPGILVGARWFFMEFLGVYAELGYTPLYIFSAGAVLRF